MFRVLTTCTYVAFATAISPLSVESQSRRTLGRFTRGHADNAVCWDREGVDGFISVIDAHQHPMPFGGPEVPFSTYTDWFIEHGVVFSVFMGIGQRIVKQNASLPDCCYYLHCPTYQYPVIPMTESDELNAEARLEHYYGKRDDRLHLTLSATFPNLQRSAGAKEMLLGLWDKYPKTFKWMGEINVFKHALAGNGFFSDFTGPRLTVARVEAGELDALFSLVGPARPNGEHIPTVTIHSDMGCDTYANSIPIHAGDGVHELECYTPEDERRTAHDDAAWWKSTLGRFYSGFFDEDDWCAGGPRDFATVGGRAVAHSPLTHPPPPPPRRRLPRVCVWRVAQAQAQLPQDHAHPRDACADSAVQGGEVRVGAPWALDGAPVAASRGPRSDPDRLLRAPPHQPLVRHVVGCARQAQLHEPRWQARRDPPVRGGNAPPPSPPPPLRPLPASVMKRSHQPCVLDAC